MLLWNCWEHFFCSFIVLSQYQSLVLNQTKQQSIAHDAAISKNKELLNNPIDVSQQASIAILIDEYSLDYLGHL